MIQLHKLNGEAFVLNASHIEVIDTTPNTVITLTNSKKFVVSESAEEVVRLTVEYKRDIYQSFR
ncbi:MAG: flagellar protein FlbD [Spirochaetae bacterium HGW-Spirochaetae-5]|nr:MAG: flagellar protein FlbD [Spirochaetae bacterium HGW-Spirochaetae-5]